MTDLKMTDLKMTDLNPIARTALAVLRVEDPELCTSKGLSNLIQSIQYFVSGFEFPDVPYQMTDRLLEALAGVDDPHYDGTVTRIMSDPVGWAIDANEEIQKNAVFLESLGSVLSPKDLTNIVTSRAARDNIVKLQEILGLSAIVGMTTRSLLGEDVPIYNVDDQLRMTEADRAKVKSDIPRLTDLFVSQFFEPGDYTLWETDGGEDDSSDFQTIMNVVRSVAKKALSASICPVKMNWKDDGEGGFVGTFAPNAEIDPDEFTISFEIESEKSRHFVAKHKDAARYPWKTIEA
jgi:hypothetical protein